MAKMVKSCLIRGFRIAGVLFVLVALTVVAVCLISPNISYLKASVVSQLQRQLQAEKVSISDFKLTWDAGPSLDMGELTVLSPNFSLERSHAVLSFSFGQWLQGSYAPMVTLKGGALLVRLDPMIADQAKVGFSVPNIRLVLDDMALTWLYDDEQHTLEGVAAHVSPLLSDIMVRAKGFDFELVLNQDRLPQQLRLDMRDFSWLPKAWRRLVQNLDTVHFLLNKTNDKMWKWQFQAEAEQGLVHLEQAHVKLPFAELYGQGKLSYDNTFTLQMFEASQLHWQDGKNFADLTLNWQDDVLNLEIIDGRSTMPMLWSWLWLIDEEASWHQWLSSMQHGVFKDVQAKLNLPWKSPLTTAPTPQDVSRLTYHVLTHIEDADIALGAGNKFLRHTDAYVELDQDHLTAAIQSAELGNNLGRLHGDYAIAWDTLLMQVEAQGVVDLGKLHVWLDDEVAPVLAWGRSAAYAQLDMTWYANQASPEQMHLLLKPKGKWRMRPKGVALTMQGGVVTLDLNHGLQVSNMRFSSPWFDGDMAMFIANKKGEWGLDTLHLTGETALVQLTTQLSLPITNAQGKTHILLDYQQGSWTGALDFSASSWRNFLGYDKPEKETLKLSFSGQSGPASLLPMVLDKAVLHQRGLANTMPLQASMKLTEQNMDLTLQAIELPAYYGDLRLLLPWNDSMSWGVEVNADYVHKNAFAVYMRGEEASAPTAQRAWTLYADVAWLAWGDSHAEELKLQYTSAKESALSFTADNVYSADADLQQVKASLSLLDSGKFDLHMLEASGSDQHLLVSGSLQPLASGLLKWQGMVLMNGEFGALMHQAELDKLFQQGEMTALFLGGGEFELGKPWWQGMEGRFRLRVNDGRIMQGGTLVRLLAAVSLVDLPKYFIFQRDDMVGEGLLYEQMQLEAEFLNEKLHINQLAFQSSALDAGGRGEIDLASGELDIVLIARPWQNMEAILGAIPLLGTILTGKDKSLLRKVYRIHGPASDAQVDELNPEDVGLPSSGLLEALFSLPSQWFGEKKGE